MAAARLRHDGRVEISLHSAPADDLDAATLYRILRLRVDVFVVEQECPYPELDGRDLAPGTVHHWAVDAAGDVVATLRLLRDDLPGGGWRYRLGRVCASPTVRGQGVTGRLMGAALAEMGQRESVLDAQSHLLGWYSRFGYRADGPEFIEDGIPHTPMRRSP